MGNAMNKLGINLWNWKSGLSDACCGLPTKAAEMGFTAVELPMTQTQLSPDLRDELKSLDVEVSLCAAMSNGRDFSSFDPVVRASTMEYLTQCLETGASVGASILVGPLYAGGGKRHVLPPEETAREWDLAVRGLQELSHRAEEYGIRLALEPLNRYRTSVINTVEQVLRLIAEIDRDNVGIHYDTYHACLEEADLLSSLETALQSGKVTHFHACSNNRGAPGDGIVPWNAIMTLLKEYAYSGHITMETFAPGGLDASWVNVHGTPDEVAERGLHFLKRYF